MTRARLTVAATLIATVARSGALPACAEAPAEGPAVDFLDRNLASH